MINICLKTRPALHISVREESIFLGELQAIFPLSIELLIQRESVPDSQFFFTMASL